MQLLPGKKTLGDICKSKMKEKESIIVNFKLDYFSKKFEIYDD
jgi:hypothetical protein